MQVVHGHRSVPAWRGAAIAIGNFDGVHLGHRALIARARELAAANDALTVALTFDPHPSALLAPTRAPRMLTSVARRLELLAEAGVDAVVVEPFTRELSGIAPNAFVDDIVIFALRARAIVVGYNFSYGQGRTGTVDALRAHGSHAGIEVAIVPAVTVDGEIAASTVVRGHLRAGELARVERMLGRRWDVDGVVVHGAGRGRAIGVPTANIAPEVELAVAPGIYAVTLGVEGGPAMPAVASLGTNPTFVEDGGLVLEVHVLDWDGDLYDRRVRTTFVARLRDELKFASVEALVAQIRRDIDQARAALAP
ncbi:MAG TPA: bifunctional riboflavin kinase/FAD synthetase [Kofleriaceae bacterium]|nr:bifunctional riboflavin kinase/FAD synthetase [Kofleriaceae bacterium]HMG55797.1 bifunctional riboflavin kinase/FAD synthetase [Kofleriaceae bacterium]